MVIVIAFLDIEHETLLNIIRIETLPSNNQQLIIINIEYASMETDLRQQMTSIMILQYNILPHILLNTVPLKYVIHWQSDLVVIFLQTSELEDVLILVSAH